MGFLGGVSLFIQGDSSILNGKFLLGTSVGGDETEALCQQTEHASASISELQALKAEGNLDKDLCVDPHERK